MLKSWEAGVDIHGVAVQVPAEDGTIVSSSNGAELTSRDSRSLSSESAGRTSRNSDDGDETREGLVLTDTCNVARSEAGARGWESIRSTRVLDDTVGETEGSVVASRWASTLGGGTEEIRANGLVRLDDDIVTLAKGDIDKVSLVWLDGDKVRGCEDKSVLVSKLDPEMTIHTDDCHRVVVDTHSPSRLSSSVGKAEEIFHASLDFPRCVCAGREIRQRVFAVEEVVGCAQWTCVGNYIVFLSSRNIEASYMLVPEYAIRDTKYSQIADQDTSHIHVIIGAGRSLDDNGALNTIRELGNEMTVIPGGAVGTGNPLVDTGITWCQTAFGNTWNTILVVGAELTDAVPVDGGRIVSQCVVNSDLDGITPVAHNGGSWNLTIDGKSRSWGSLIVPLNA